jgi:hypothetical protein
MTQSAKKQSKTLESLRVILPIISWLPNYKHLAAGGRHDGWSIKGPETSTKKYNAGLSEHFSTLE